MKMVTDSFQSDIIRRLGYTFRLLLPAGYKSAVRKRWALLLFLHGMGERGDDLAKLEKHGPLRHVEVTESYPMIIACPQCPADEWWHPDTLAAFLDHLEQKYRIDNSRIYLTGFSMGGAGTWALANAYPHRFAAIAPVAGFFTPGDPMRFKSLPIWCIHGAMDTIVPVSDSIRMVSWVREANVNVKLTIDSVANHTAITTIYKDPALYDWLLAQQSAGETNRSKKSER